MKNKKSYAFAISFMLLAGVSSAQAATVDGVIKGAQCYIQSHQCVESKNDPHLVLENDFVLVSGADYYFLPNLPRSEKLSLYNETIRIEGEVSDNKIDVEKVIRKSGNKEQVLWDGAEIYSDLYES